MRLIWYRVSHWLRYSVAVRPLLLSTVGLVLAIAGSRSESPNTADRAEVLTGLTAIAAAALFMVSASVSLILSEVAFATGVYSPRLAARLVARPLVVWGFGLIGATLVCAGVSAIIIVGSDADDVGVVPLFVSAALLALSFVGMIFITASMSMIHRVSNVVGTTARDGLKEIEKIYPKAAGEADTPGPDPPTGKPDEIVRSGDSTYGVLLGIFTPWLVGIARVHGATLMVLPAVGDIVEPGTPLIHVFGSESIPHRTLLAGMRLGEGRTIEQDPLFALRLLVDVAARALSPAVNDPYTAVQSLDRIAQLLAVLSQRDLGGGWRTDRQGTVRLWYAAPDWDDYVLLAFTEIRDFGARSTLVARRLRAVLLDLSAVVPPKRLGALGVQVGLLDDAVTAAFPNAAEREQAMTPDRQGIGGSRNVGWLPAGREER